MPLIGSIDGISLAIAEICNLGRESASRDVRCGVTWVKIFEVNSGEWGISGKPLTTEAVKELAAEVDGQGEPCSLTILA